MSAAIRSADGKGSIKHAGQEYKSRTRVASFIVPVLPHKGIRSIALAGRRRHDCHNHDCDEPNSYAEESSKVEDPWQDTVSEHDGAACHPCHEEVCDEDMPSLWDVIFMLDGPAGDDGVGAEEGDGGRPEDPCEDIPPVGVSSYCTVEEDVGELTIQRRNWQFVRTWVQRSQKPNDILCARQYRLSNYSQLAIDLPEEEDGMAEASSARAAPMQQ